MSGEYFYMQCVRVCKWGDPESVQGLREAQPLFTVDPWSSSFFCLTLHLRLHTHTHTHACTHTHTHTHTHTYTQCMHDCAHMKWKPPLVFRLSHLTTFSNDLPGISWKFLLPHQETMDHLVPLRLTSAWVKGAHSQVWGRTVYVM